VAQILLLVVVRCSNRIFGKHLLTRELIQNQFAVCLLTCRRKLRLYFNTTVQVELPLRDDLLGAGQLGGVPSHRLRHVHVRLGPPAGPQSHSERRPEHRRSDPSLIRLRKL
jgi:hypothetical protein